MFRFTLTAGLLVTAAGTALGQTGHSSCNYYMLMPLTAKDAACAA